jgi:hypothetical protein
MDKDLQESIIRQSGLDWIIVRPMLLTNGPWTGNYRVGEDLKPGRRSGTEFPGPFAAGGSVPRKMGRMNVRGQV